MKIDLLLTDCHAATLSEGEGGYGVIEDAAVAAADGRILTSALGIPRERQSRKEEID